MSNRPSVKRRRWAASCIAIANLLVLAGAANALSTSGPLHTKFGRDYIAAQSLELRPGQIGDFAASIDNHASHPVTIERATLIAAAGLAAPSLYAVAIGVPIEEFEGRGWPITTAAGTVHPLPATAGSGPGWLYYGVRGTSPGVYDVLGLRVTYESAGHTYTMSAWGPAVLCVGISDSKCDPQGQMDRLIAQIQSH